MKLLSHILRGFQIHSGRGFAVRLPHVPREETLADRELGASIVSKTSRQYKGKNHLALKDSLMFPRAFIDCLGYPRAIRAVVPFPEDEQ